ncbi:ARM repeat-containing protein [Thelephora ganbajun]|uniref:ARM repeat-containing protein n=1 Tax=Thelephora ganbajun TaxID=370292 RepID=A0ACB6ZXS8_THEGA|nr:ARM repeat-containing protein [Thelephora ganbajun]
MSEPTSSWVCPPERTEIIENLVSGVDRYNPSNIGILEDYLYHQTRSEEYDCLANLAILKLYQFNSTLYNSDVVIHILIKALTSSPFPDFHLCVSLLDERPSSANADEPDPLPSILPQLQQLYALLQQCRFPAFWILYLSEDYRVLREEYTVESVAFEDSVRKVVVRAVKAAFTRIGVKRLSSYFNLEGSAFETFVSKLGWTIENEVVIVPPNPDNQIRSTVVHETITLPQLVKVITHTARTG